MTRESPGLLGAGADETAPPHVRQNAYYAPYSEDFIDDDFSGVDGDSEYSEQGSSESIGELGAGAGEIPPPLVRQNTYFAPYSEDFIDDDFSDVDGDIEYSEQGSSESIGESDHWERRDAIMAPPGTITSSDPDTRMRQQADFVAKRTKDK